MNAISTGRRPITPQQLKTIHVGRRKLGMSDDDYRAFLGRFGASSARDLTISQARKILDHMMAMGFTIQPARPTPPDTRHAMTPTPASHGNVVALPTGAQRRMIREMAGEISWRKEEGFQAWLEHNMGMKRIRTKEEAGRVIEGLKGLKRHEHTAGS